MHSQQQPELKQKENPVNGIFNQICDLARKHDETGLRQLIASGICINIYHGLRTPVAELAFEGEHKAVDLLLNKLGANPNQALWGYACRGDKDRVHLLMQEEGLFPYSAIYGYLVGNCKNEAEALLKI